MPFKKHRSELVKQVSYGGTLQDFLNQLVNAEIPRDIHREQAAEMFGVAYEDVTDEQRRRAKVRNFGFNYGGYGA